MEKLMEFEINGFVLQMVRFRKTYQIFFMHDGKITDIYTTTSKRRAYKMYFELEEKTHE